MRSSIVAVLHTLLDLGVNRSDRMRGEASWLAELSWVPARDFSPAANHGNLWNEAVSALGDSHSLRRATEGRYSADSRRRGTKVREEK